jgi:hypothetical protein
MHRVFVNCGYFMTPPASPIGAFTSLDGYFEQDIHLCSSTIKATVKEVTFVHNHTLSNSDLSGLSVTQVLVKNYSSPQERPLWAVETPIGGQNISAYRPLWGLVNDKYKDAEGITTTKTADFYLPAWSWIDAGYNEMAAMSFDGSLVILSAHILNHQTTDFYRPLSKFLHLLGPMSGTQVCYYLARNRTIFLLYSTAR